jgi:hypothetical protein
MLSGRVDEQSQSLQSLLYYTGILAGALWISRLIMLEAAEPSDPWPVPGLASK